jgi:hypothetical protein
MLAIPCVLDTTSTTFFIQNAFSICHYFTLAATCFGRTTIFKREFLQRNLPRLTTNQLFFRMFANLVDYGDRFLVTVPVVTVGELTAVVLRVACFDTVDVFCLRCIADSIISRLWLRAVL